MFYHAFSAISLLNMNFECEYFEFLGGVPDETLIQDLRKYFQEGI